MMNVKTIEIPAGEYVRRFREPEKFVVFCRECANYGTTYACPPFLHGEDRRLMEWKNALIVVWRYRLPEGRHRISDSAGLMVAPKARLEKMLLGLERLHGGLAFGIGGGCSRCGLCERISGRPCRHPESVRPPLEAYGFDLCRTISELFGMEMEWAEDGFLPESLTLVGALFHNKEAGEISLSGLL